MHDKTIFCPEFGSWSAVGTWYIPYQVHISLLHPHPHTHNECPLFYNKAQNKLTDSRDQTSIPQNISETSPTSAKYLHCGGAPQSAVTHAGANSGAFVVSFQVKNCSSPPLLDRSTSPVATTCRPGGPCEDPGHSCGGLPHLLDRHPCPRRHRGRQAGEPCPVCEQ